MNKTYAFILGMIFGIVLTQFFQREESNPLNDIKQNNVSLTSQQKEDKVREIKSSDNSGIELFDKPGGCVSRKRFQVEKVLDSGNAFASEIMDMNGGLVLTTDLQVLILAKEGDNFYNNQILKAPKGKCAIQIGNYKYKEYGETQVIPIIEFR